MMKKVIAIAVFIVAGLQASLAGDRLQASIATLEMLQDRMAQGDAGAEGQQGRLIAQIETDLLNGLGQLPADRKILESLVVLLFSGGNPGIVEKRLAKFEDASEKSHLIKGALAYVRADRGMALKELSGLDASSLSAPIGGRVALVRAILLASSDMPKALADLDAARRLMPGTLIEEAALRRCVAFAGVQKDVSRFQTCGKKYMRRFATSIYSKDFDDGLVKSAVQLGGSLAVLQEMMEILPSTRRRLLALALARAAVMSGAMGLARASAEWAQTLAMAGSHDMGRAYLYAAAAEIAGETGSEALKRFGEIDENMFDPADRKLLADLRQLRAEIEREPEMPVEEALRIAPPGERGSQLEVTP